VTPFLRRFVDLVCPREWVDLPAAERARAWRAVHAAGFLASLTATVRTGLRLDAITDAVGSARRRVSMRRLSLASRGSSVPTETTDASTAQPLTPMTPLTRLRKRAPSGGQFDSSDEGEEEEEEDDVEEVDEDYSDDVSPDGDHRRRGRRRNRNHGDREGDNGTGRRRQGTTKRLVVRFTDRWAPCFAEYDAPHFRFFVTELFFAWAMGIVTGLRGSTRQCQIGLILFLVFEAAYVVLFFVRRPVMSRLGHAWIGLIVLLQFASTILLLAGRSASRASLAEYSYILSVAAGCLCAVRCAFEALAYAALMFCVGEKKKATGAPGGSAKGGTADPAAAKAEGAATLLDDDDEDREAAARGDLGEVLLIPGPNPADVSHGAAGAKTRPRRNSAVSGFTSSARSGDIEDDDDTELLLFADRSAPGTSGARREVPSVLWDMTASAFGDGASSVADNDDDDRLSAWDGNNGGAGAAEAEDATTRRDAAARAVLTPPRYYTAAASPPMWLQDAVLLYSTPHQQHQQQQRQQHRR
jgi:hypothetical protein